MSFLKEFISKKIHPKKHQRTSPHDTEKPSMIVMQSNTLGMTVIQQTDGANTGMLEISSQQWINILLEGKLDGVPYNRIYFSFLKGIPNFLRMKIWLMLCTQNSSRNYVFSGICQKRLSQEMKQAKHQQQKQNEGKAREGGIFSIFTLELFQKLIQSKPKAKQSEQIEKDISRTYSNKIKYKYTQPLMRKILYGLSNSGVEYIQGMNYILLYVIIFCLESLGVTEQTFSQLSLQNERNIFIILREIVLRLDQVFAHENIFKVLKELEQKMSETVPDVFFLIYKLGMDTYSLFSQNYYSLLTYSDPPDELTKQMIDLFFLESDKAITSLIVRMLEIAHDQILKIKDAEALQMFIKNQMFHFCFKTLCEDKLNAKTIDDFGISFYQNVEHC